MDSISCPAVQRKAALYDEQRRQTVYNGRVRVELNKDSVPSSRHIVAAHLLTRNHPGAPLSQSARTAAIAIYSSQNSHRCSSNASLNALRGIAADTFSSVASARLT